MGNLIACLKPITLIHQPIEFSSFSIMKAAINKIPQITHQVHVLLKAVAAMARFNLC